jgi:hypothetical protein
MSRHSGTVSWVRTNHYLLFLINTGRLAKTQPILISYFFDFTHQWLVPAVYCIRGEHANYDTSDIVF